MSGRRGLFADGESGEGFGSRKRLLPDADLDITPMIDVTFLLLIFFMVTSTMQGSPDQEVPTARHGVGVDAATAIVVQVRAPESIGDDPSVYIQEGGAARETSLEALKRYVAETGAGKSAVIVKADRDVPHGFVQAVAQTVENVEGKRFYVGVNDERDE